MKPDIGENGKPLADKFWCTALARTLVVYAGLENLIEGASNKIVHIEQVADQAHQPNFDAAVLTGTNALTQ